MRLPRPPVAGVTSSVAVRETIIGSLTTKLSGHACRYIPPDGNNRLRGSRAGPVCQSARFLERGGPPAGGPPRLDA